MRETSKSVARRLATPGFVGKFFVGAGIDIGGAPDSLGQFEEQFPLITDLVVWDLEDGDAQHMAGISSGTYDFVHSSHCLEHLCDPFEGLRNWMRILKPGGYLVVTIPDEDLYEQGIFPSSFNYDHRHTFTIYKTTSWSPKSVNVFDLISSLGAEAEVMHIQLLHATFHFRHPRFDQTSTAIGECAIEFVVRKRLSPELEAGGRFHSPKSRRPG